MCIRDRYYTAATDGSYYGEDFYATIGLCCEDEVVELFRLCTCLLYTSESRELPGIK